MTNMTRTKTHAQVAENEIIQQKAYEKEQADIKHIKEFIASCGARPPPARCALSLPPATGTRGPPRDEPSGATSGAEPLPRARNAGTYANLVKQAKSKQKILDKMYEAGLTPPVVRARRLPPPLPAPLHRRTSPPSLARFGAENPVPLLPPPRRESRRRSGTSPSPSRTARSCRRR